MRGSDGTAGPGTHYELFAGLREAGADYLLAGTAALVLHGAPRLATEIELAADPGPGNVRRLERRLAAWGYCPEAAPARGALACPLQRFRHPFAALATIDVLLPPAADYERLRAGAACVPLVDLQLPLIGAHDLLALLERSGSAEDREAAASLRLLVALRAGDTGAADGDATRREQVRKFSRWSAAARLDWLLAAARLARGLSPEARPTTRGLVRRRGWYPGR